MVSSLTPAVSTATQKSSVSPFFLAVGFLTLLESLLIFVPMTILGQAIPWPASLDAPANEILPLIHQKAGAVWFGYVIYLLYSVLFWPVSHMIVRAVQGEEPSRLLQVATGFGVASMAARCLGILRWLVAMPALARAYTDASATPETRQILEIVYRTLNDYGGSVGELLGVSLFAALWLLLTSFYLLSSKAPVLPRWVGGFGIVVTLALLLPWYEVATHTDGPGVTIGSALLHFWLLTVAVLFLRRKSNS